jgi:hypothetical protein
MRRVMIIAAASIALAGCSSLSLPGMSSPPPPPTTVSLQLESVPPGATATPSTGGGCKTPCSVDVPATEPLSVTFTLARYQPQTVAVQPVQTAAETSSSIFSSPPPPKAEMDPNPVHADLQRAGPQRRGAKRRAVKRPARASAAAPASVAPAADTAQPAAASPFPTPAQQ